MLWPVSIELAETSIALADVRADVVIHHGRESIEDQSAASTCQLTFYAVDNAFVSAFEVGQSLRVMVADGAAPFPRFTGRITDARLDVADLTVIAAGPWSVYRTFQVGDAAWPVEAWSARVVRIFAEAGLGSSRNLVANPGFETNTAGWDTGASWWLNPGATIARTTERAYEGAASARITCPGSSAQQGVRLIALPVEVGKTYRATIRIYSESGATALNFAVGSGGVTSVAVPVTAVPGQWVEAAISVTATASGSTQLAVYVPAAAAAAFLIDVCEVRDENGALELRADPSFDPQLAARDPVTAGPTTLGDYLDFLAPMVGALVADRPDGTIVVQAIGARTLASSVALDPADVAYAPIWVEQLPGGNIVTVRYTGDQSQRVTATEPASTALYGERPETIDTTFTDVAAANARASQRLGRAAFSHWEVPQAPILRGLDLQLGNPVVLEGLPAAAPFEPWTPVLEGWTDTITGPDWAMELALSDPLISGIALPWNSVPSTSDYRWNTIDPLTDWTEALTLEALTAD